MGVERYAYGVEDLSKTETGMGSLIVRSPALEFIRYGSQAC
jgi:hypothetical protein